MSKQYSDFAKHYDLMMGDRTKTVNFISELISQENANASNVLELACGTGQILKPLSRKYDVYGLDLSKEMLFFAEKRISKSNLFHSDMTNFNLNIKFDVILCLFDSINHLTSFEDWRKVFSKVSLHLNKNGVFIFDINTLSKLDKLTKIPPGVNKFNNNISVMSISNIGKNLINWNVKIFEHISKDKYNLIEEDIKEASFPIAKIKSALYKEFRKVKVIDGEKKRASEKSNRVYFICKL